MINVMIQDGEVLFGHSERYSDIKNDSDLNKQLITRLFSVWKPQIWSFF